MADRSEEGAVSRVRGGAGGMTVLELVTVAAVLGLLLVAGLAAARPHGAWQAARAARAFLLWGRLEAIWSGRPVVIEGVGSAGLVARSGGSRPACEGEEIRRLRLADFGRVTLARGLRAGIEWLPAGGARSCATGGVISDRMVLDDGARLVGVVISSLGRVRLEAAP